MAVQLHLCLNKHWTQECRHMATRMSRIQLYMYVSGTLLIKRHFGGQHEIKFTYDYVNTNFEDNVLSNAFD